MGTVRATQTINSGFGTFNRKDPIAGVPDATVAAWIAAGIAAADPDPAAPAPGAEVIDLNALTVKELTAMAAAEGLDVGKRPTKPTLIAALASAGSDEPQNSEGTGEPMEPVEGPGEAKKDGLTADG